MAELTQDVMFRDYNTPGHTSEQIAALNFELMDVLGALEPGTKEYVERAKAFREEALRR
jgi:hypothetical protein